MSRPACASFTDVLLSILERGFVIAIRLDGPPGERRLLCGVGLADAADPMLLALCAAGAFRSQRDDFDDSDDLDDFGWAP